MRWRVGKAHSLSLGAQGADVAELQERLRRLGYHPGEPDGCYGYLTQDAVTSFQRDNGLRVDGIAGPRVLSLVRQSALPGNRRVYVLDAGEDLAGAALRLGVTTEALRHMNRLAPNARGYPGQRLVCRQHYLLAALPPGDRAAWAASRVASLLTAVSLPLAMVAEGKVAVQPAQPSIRELTQRHGLQTWITVSPRSRILGKSEHPADIGMLLGRPKWRHAAACTLAELSAKERAGIWLDLGQPRWGDGPRLLSLIRMLSTQLTQLGRPLMVTLPLPAGSSRWRWWLSDIDYNAISVLADRIVLDFRVTDNLDSFAMYCRRLEAVLSLVSPWKCLLGVGLRAEVRDTRGRWLGEVAYPRAVTAAYLAKVRPKWDPVRRLLRAPIAADMLAPELRQLVAEQSQKSRAGSDNQAHESATDRTTETGTHISDPPAQSAQLPADCTDQVLWLPGRDAVADRLALIHRFNLAGAAFWAVGEEDVRVWDVVPKRIAPEHAGT